MKYKLSTFLFLLLFFVGGAHSVFAAELRFSADATTVHVGDTVKVRVLVGSTTAINAVSSQITFPKNTLSVQSLSKSNSIISLWAVEPSYSNASGTISLEGVALNGYTGNSGTVLTIVFKAKAAGSGTLQINSGSVLANDGEGTNILSTKGSIGITVAPAVEKTKEVTSKETTAVITLPQIQIEELKKKDDMDPRSRFLITSTARNQKVPYRVEIDALPQTWNDTGTHIFETGALARGEHTLKVYMEGTTGEMISNSLSFITSGIMTPVISDYSNDISENDFIVVKGVADPMVYVTITMDGTISGTATPFHEVGTVRADEQGVFIFVANERAVKGSYLVSARSKTESGIESEQTVPVRLTVFGDLNFFKKASDMLSLTIPFIAVLALFILLIMYCVYRIIHYRKHLGSKITEAEALIEKSFGILEEDLDEEVKIFKKVKALEPLTDEEKAFVKQFKKDLRAAEKVIVAEVKNTKKNKS